MSYRSGGKRGSKKADVQPRGTNRSRDHSISKIKLNSDIEDAILRSVTSFSRFSPEGEGGSTGLGSDDDEDTSSCEEPEVFREDESAKSTYSGSDSSSSCDSSDTENSMSSHHYDMATTSLTSTWNKAAVVRKLIREDRFQMKQLGDRRESEIKVRKQLIASMKNPIKQSFGTDLKVNNSVDTVFTSETSSAGELAATYKLKPGVPQHVRINVSSESVKGGSSKLILADRLQPVDLLVQLVRNKFGASKKFACLLLLPSREKLDEDRLLSLKDGASLILTSDAADAATNSSLRVANKKQQHAQLQVQAPAQVFEDHDDAFRKEESRPAEAPSSEPQKKSSCEYSNLLHDEDNFSTPSPRAVGDEEANTSLKTWYAQLSSQPEFPNILSKRRALPIFRKRDRILEMSSENQVIIISGETGSGKTTQVPAYILEHMIESGRGCESYIICTQPRRIAAISVAERVAYEHLESVGEMVGYQVRLANRCSANTRIVYCTTGTLLRRLHDPDFLLQVSHIVVDEVHERQVETDFLMTILKQRAPDYPHLRLIMMSATMQEDLFSSYFSCPIVYVEGRTFPVQEHYLEEIRALVASAQREVAAQRQGIEYADPFSADRPQPGKFSGKRKAGKQERLNAQMTGAVSSHRLPKFDAENVAEIVIRIIQTHSSRGRASFLTQSSSTSSSDSGEAVLVFLSGMQAIERVNRALRQRNMSALNARVHILHGSLPPEQQKKVFIRTKPGEWKVILSTNVAETSVTVDDVTHVVDCGLVKEMRYDPVANMSSLEEVVISKASARQRAGRAGRVKPGHCWRLYTSEFHASSAMEDQPQPEIRRVPLEEVVLQVLLLQLGRPEQFLGQCLEPPSMDQIRASVQCLLEIKAILPEERLPLTALGFHLAKLPVDVRIGKMLITASVLGCLDPALTVAAALGGKVPFFHPPNNRDDADRAHSAFANSYGFYLLAQQYDIDIPEPPSKHGSPDNHVFFSDHLAIVNAYNLWLAIKRRNGNEAASAFCRERFLSYSSLEEIRKLREHFRSYLRSAGFDGPTQRKGRSAGVGVDDEAATAASGRGGDGDGNESIGVEEDDNDIIDGDDGDDDGDDSEDSELSRARTPAGISADFNGELAAISLLRCALCAGLYPQVVRAGRFSDTTAAAAGSGSSTSRKKSGKELPIRILQKDRDEVFVHPTSLTTKYVKYLLDAGEVLGQDPTKSTSKDAFIVYHKKVATTKIYLHDCTAIPPAAMLLFSGDMIVSKSSKGKNANRREGRYNGIAGREVVVTTGGWIQFRMPELHAVLFRCIRREFEAILEAKVTNPRADITERQKLLIQAIRLTLSVA